MYGFNNQGEFSLPPFVTQKLHECYWYLRVTKPKGPRRRTLYRWIEKEKLKLAEMHIEQELIEATCRYMANLSVVSGRRMQEIMNRPRVQLILEFTYRSKRDDLPV